MLEFREDVTMVGDVFGRGSARRLGEGVGGGEEIGRLERSLEMTFEFGIGKDMKSPGADRDDKTSRHQAGRKIKKLNGCEE